MGTSYSCPLNANLSGTSCTCAANYDQSGPSGGVYACTLNLEDQYCSNAAGQQSGRTEVIAVTNINGHNGETKTVCSGPFGPLSNGTSAFCAMTGSVSMCAGGSFTDPTVTSGHCWVEKLVFTGADCTAVTQDSEPPVTKDALVDPMKPPKGYCPGEVNGLTIWVPCTNTVETSTPKTSTSTVSTPTGTTTVTITETTTTTCTGDGSCTTVSNVTNSTGSGGTPTTTTTTGTSSGSKGEFCKQNPTAFACAGDGSSSFGGACNTGFVCDGDAAMCAIARATNQLKCGMLDGTATEAATYDAAKASTSTGVGTDTVAISSASFDTSNALAVSATCVSDLAVTVMGNNMTLPFSNLCTYLAQLGNLLMAVSFLLAIRIVGRG